MSRPADLTNVNGTLYFSANDGTMGGVVEDGWDRCRNGGGQGIITGVETPDVGLTNVNGTLYFVASNGTHGFELWSLMGPPPER